MHAKTILFVTLLVVAAYVLWPSSKTQGESTTEYYGTQDPGPADTITVITPDELSRIITLTQAALNKKIGKCTYCIETTNISLTNNVYSGRFLFTVLPEPGGAPYGLSVDSTVNGDTVTNITLQSQSTIDQMDPYDQFKAGSDIKQGITLPTLADLQSAMKRM